MERKSSGIRLEDAQETARARMAALPVGQKIVTCPLCGCQFLTYDDLVSHYMEVHPDSTAPMLLHLTVNNVPCRLIIEPYLTLKEVLQFQLGLTGVKHMCDRGQCGSCTVILDGKPSLSCNTLAADCDGKSVETVEGIALNPKWKPLIDAYCKWDAMQCGYCTPGFLVSAKALLDREPNPNTQQIKQALSGNICICGTYPRHAQAILEAVETMAKGGIV